MVNFAYVESAEQLFPTKTIQLGRMCQTLELWQASPVVLAARDWLDGFVSDMAAFHVAHSESVAYLIQAACEPSGLAASMQCHRCLSCNSGIEGVHTV